MCVCVIIVIVIKSVVNIVLTVGWCCFVSDGACSSYTGSACQSVFNPRTTTTVFIKASVNINDSDAVIGRWLQQLDLLSSCYSAARLLLCHHVYPPCHVNNVDANGRAQTRPVCRQVFIGLIFLSS